MSIADADANAYADGIRTKSNMFSPRLRLRGHNTVKHISDSLDIPLSSSAAMKQPAVKSKL